MSKRKKNNGAFLFGLVVVALAAVGYGSGKGWFSAEEDQALQGVSVRRGPLRISELSRGNLESKDSARILNGLEGSATILFLAEEGTYVKEGDLICELDVSALEDRSVTQEIEVKSSEAKYTKSKEQYEIQEIQNQTDEAEAALALELARLDLEKYIDVSVYGGEYDPRTDPAPTQGEWAHELAQAEEAIKLAEEEKKQAEDTIKWTTELFEKGFVQRTELERDQLAVERAKIKVEQASRELDLALKYGYKRKLAELSSAVESRERDILKVQKQSIAKLADLEAERESDRYRLEREKERFREIKAQLEVGKLYAPVSGMLVYSRTRSHRGGGGEVPQEGSTVTKRQELATIPREGGMTVDVSLHETKLDNVRVGQTVRVKVDAIPGQVFEGTVDFVAAVADSGSWMSNPNQRLYRTEVTLAEFTPEMRPGMSCEVEILIEDLTDVLYVPRQSVYLDGRQTVVFLNQDGQVQAREVKVGLDNSKWVVVESGLEEGDTVLLSPPASWEPSKAVEPESAIKAKPVAPGDPAARPGMRPTSSGMDEEQRAAMRKSFEGMSDEEKAAMRKKYSGSGG
jgi:HlyD family secretion protein